MLSEKQKLKFLQETSLFTDARSEALASICKITQEQDYPAEHILFHEGDDGDSLYLIVGGEVGIPKDAGPDIGLKRYLHQRDGSNGR